MKLFRKSALLVLFMSVICSLFTGCSSKSDNSGVADDESKDAFDSMTKADATGSLTLVFTGDVMLAGNVEARIKTTGTGDYRYPWFNVAAYLQQADIAFINLESMISDKGVVSSDRTSTKYRANPLAMNGLQYAGIDVVSLANEHAFDYGRTAMEDCITRLRSAGIRCVGAGFSYDEAYMPTYITAKGKKVAFLAYTNRGNSAYRAQATYVNWQGRTIPGTSGVAWLYIKELEAGIAKARSDSADLIIVSIHSGTDYSSVPSADQDVFAHLAIDRGADIVVGHSPHVTQPTVVYEKSYNSYSLGNFIYDQTETYLRRGVTRGKVLEVVWENGEISSVAERKTRISTTTWQPSFE